MEQEVKSVLREIFKDLGYDNTENLVFDERKVAEALDLDSLSMTEAFTFIEGAFNFDLEHAERKYDISLQDLISLIISKKSLQPLLAKI